MLRHKRTLLAVPLVLCACGTNLTTPDETIAAGQLALGTLAEADHGLTRTLSPSPALPGPPFYARTAPPPEPVYFVEGLAVIQFYRDPACIPPDFNLLTFFDPPDAYRCTLLVEGFALAEGTPPKVVRQRGTHAVPFWFVPADAVRAAIHDGELTIGELSALPGRMVGHATSFNEMQHPTAPPDFGDGGHRNPMLTQSAAGTLEDGRAFEYHLAEVDGSVKAIQLHFR